MANIKKYNLSGEQIGELSLDDTLLQGGANPQMIKDYLVAYRANQRQWSANTKTRAEVNHSGQKPHPQKGTGRARQGYLGSPQYKGGGRVFGPRPKFDQHVKLNKKEKRAVIKTLLAQKIQEQHVHVLSIEGLNAPKTKSVVEFLKKLNLAQKRVLFLAEDICLSKVIPMDEELDEVLSSTEDMQPDEAEKTITSLIDKQDEECSLLFGKRDCIFRSVRNIPKVSFALLPNVNGYEVILHQDIVLLDGPVDQLIAALGGN